jgi:cytochrome c556
VMHTTTRRTLVFLAVLALGGMLASSASAQNEVAAFMKAKLVHAEKVLEGLATEDFDLIVKHSQAISLLCQDELWSVVKTVEYHERSKEFQRSVNAITEAARQKNLDAAALAYVNTTLSCVNCHKYVRKANGK